MVKVTVYMYLIKVEQASHWKIPWMEEPGKLQSMGSQESDMTKVT